MRWLITGASGFLGSNACQALAQSDEVWCLVRSDNPPPWCANVVSGNLADPDSLRAAVATAAPDVVLHAAALADHGACERDPEFAKRINVDGSLAIAQAASSVGAQMLFISSDAVFSGEQGHYTEESPVSPTTVYGRTKAEAEERIAHLNSNSAIVRTNFFGWSPNGQRSILEFFVTSLRVRRNISGFTNYVVSSLYVEDLIDALQVIQQADEGGIFHVGSRDALSKYEFGLTVSDVFGLPSDVISPARAEGPDRNLSLVSERVERLRGRALSTQREGIIRAKLRGGFTR